MNDTFFFSAPQLKRDPLDGALERTVRSRSLTIVFAICAACHGPPPTPQTSSSSVVNAAPDSQAAMRTRDSIIYVRWNLPRLAGVGLSSGTYAAKYDLFLGLNPYFIRGQFDGDTLLDVAVQITEKATGKRGIAIIHAADSSVHIIGAGTPFGNGGDDFRWLWVWRAEPRGARSDIAPVGRELLLVEKPESAGGMIWWNGVAYVWTQHGD